MFHVLTRGQKHWFKCGRGGEGGGPLWIRSKGAQVREMSRQSHNEGLSPIIVDLRFVQIMVGGK
jgi:hypothetical protein